MKKALQFSSAVFIFLLISVSVQAQSQQVFLKFDGITGTSRTTYAPGLIEVVSFGTSAACASCVVTPGPTGSGAGKVTAGKIVFNLHNGPEAIALKALMFAQRTTKTACFAFTKATGAGKPVGYYYVILANATVIEIDEASGDDGGNSIQVSLGYSAIAYQLKTQKPDGSYGTPLITTGWNFAANNASGLPPLPAGL